MARVVIERDIEWIRQALGASSVRVVRRLGGGQHAETFEIAADTERLIFRRFPLGDDAVQREQSVLNKLTALGSSCPQLVATDTRASSPRILTSYVPGTPPAPDLNSAVLAAGLGCMRRTPVGCRTTSRRLRLAAALALANPFAGGRSST